MKDDITRLNEEAGTDWDPRELEALHGVINALAGVSQEARKRILDSASAFLRIETNPRWLPQSSTAMPVQGSPRAPFSEDTSMSPKEFLLDKQPRTDLDRIACLAYYLTNYRGTPHFKTVDLSMLNTEAAQPKFANAAYSANNAVKRGLLVPSTKGHRQLSAVGERFVRALPDRDAARQTLESLRKRSRTRKLRRGPTAGAA